jgi:hypothetical protein
MDPIVKALAVWHDARRKYEQTERELERAGDELRSAEQDLSALCVGRGITGAALQQQPPAVAPTSTPQPPTGDAGDEVMRMMHQWPGAVPGWTPPPAPPKPTNGR